MNISNRPLSPHLQVYRPQITSMMSISHRLTGIILASGIILIGMCLTVIAMGENYYDIFQNYAGFTLSKIYLFVLCYSFYYHLCNGIRHLGWDMGYGFELKTMQQSGWSCLLLSIVLTLLTWFTI